MFRWRKNYLCGLDEDAIAHHVNAANAGVGDSASTGSENLNAARRFVLSLRVSYFGNGHYVRCPQKRFTRSQSDSEE